MATLEPQSTTLPPLPLSTTTQNAILIPNYNNNNSNNNQQQIPFESLSNYEQTREQRIKENRERLQKLGIVDLTLQLNSLVSTKRTPRRNFDRKTTPIKSLPLASADPPRRSSRLQNAPPVTYTEPKEDKSRRSRDFVLEEGAKPEVYTEEHEKMLGDTEMPWTFFVDGYRADGTRIYDPINGKTCHQCRQKTLGQRTHCSKCKLVQGQFCGDCLIMRYGEHVVEANQNPNWVCPPCRGICNCSLCRGAKGWIPTGAIYRRIKSLGFKSVAHYLITTKRGPPDSENCSDAPPSAKRALPFEGLEMTNDDGSDDKAIVVLTEKIPESENDYTTAIMSASKPADDVDRSRNKSTKENTDAGSESVGASDKSAPKPRGVGRPRRSLKKENTDASQESGRASDETVSKPRCAGRPRKGSKKENTDAVEESARASDEPIPKPMCVGISRKSSKKEKTDAGEESARANDESIPKPRCVGRPRRSSTKEKTEAGEDSVLAIVDSVPKPSGIGRPRKRLKKENTAAEESARASDEPIPKPRCIGEPQKKSKKEKTDDEEESVPAIDDSVPKPSGTERLRKRSKKENSDAGEESMRVIGTVSHMISPITSTFTSNESNSNLRRSTRISKNEKVDVLEESEKTNATTEDESIVAMEVLKTPNSSDSKADSIARRLRSRNKT